MDLWRLPEDPMLRLKHYQHERAIEEEKRLVAEVKFKQDLGEVLTTRDWAVLAYSQFGNAPACHHRS